MSNDIYNEAQRVLDLEIAALTNQKNIIDDEFVKAIGLLKSCKSKVIITGMGKSGLIGRKVSSTLSSTGTPSLYLHPAESAHGDLGVIQKGDVVIAISNSGESKEMNPLLNYVKRKGIQLIAITSKKESTLSQSADVSLVLSDSKEACPLGLAPTSSTISTLALGDALAMCLLKEKGFKKEDFAEYHPGGSLGKKLLTRVKDVMHGTDSLPLVTKEKSLLEVMTSMTGNEVRGVVGVVDESSSLIGIVTDGDIRRILLKDQQALSKPVESIMTTNPKTIDQSELAAKAHFIMQNFKIQCLFVVDNKSSNTTKPIGFVRYIEILELF